MDERTRGTARGSARHSMYRAKDGASSASTISRSARSMLLRGHVDALREAPAPPSPRPRARPRADSAGPATRSTPTRRARRRSRGSATRRARRGRAADPRRPADPPDGAAPSEPGSRAAPAAGVPAGAHSSARAAGEAAAPRSCSLRFRRPWCRGTTAPRRGHRNRVVGTGARPRGDGAQPHGSGLRDLQAAAFKARPRVASLQPAARRGSASPLSSADNTQPSPAAARSELSSGSLSQKRPPRSGRASVLTMSRDAP